MERFEYLLDGFISGTLNTSELEEFAGLLEDNGGVVEERILSDLQNHFYGGLTTPEQRARMLASIKQQRERTGIVKRMKPWTKYVAAASIILLLATAAYFIFNKNTTEKPVANEQIKTDVLPGHDGAILTLADGTKIVLDSANNGIIAQQNNVKIVKNDSGSISYKLTANSQQLTAFNTMTTPKGRQFSLVLPDGTQVWLNAASSITYPTAFVGKERKVSITGEAYFEVQHNAKQPFRVQLSNGTIVEDIGTAFNVNAYSDEGEIKTTLIEGSVRIANSDKRTAILQPNQQSLEIPQTSVIRVLKNVDISEATAWKNGFFSFSGMGIESVMRQLERWYDIDVQYEGKIPDRQFAGQIDRNATLSQVLKILQESNVHFRLNNRTLVVTP